MIANAIQTEIQQPGKFSRQRAGKYTSGNWRIEKGFSRWDVFYLDGYIFSRTKLADAKASCGLDSAQNMVRERLSEIEQKHAEKQAIAAETARQQKLRDECFASTQYIKCDLVPWYEWAEHRVGVSHSEITEYPEKAARQEKIEDFQNYLQWEATNDECAKLICELIRQHFDCELDNEEMLAMLDRHAPRQYDLQTDSADALAEFTEFIGGNASEECRESHVIDLITGLRLVCDSGSIDWQKVMVGVAECYRDETE